MRTGVLSDDYIMNNVCVEYRPVPLGKVDNVLSTSLEPKHNLELRQMKYMRPPPRPSSFFAMANSLSNQADPTNPLPFQQQLANRYVAELGQRPVPGQKRERDVPQMGDVFDEQHPMGDVFQTPQKSRPNDPQGQKRNAPGNDVPQMGGIFQEAQRSRPDENPNKRDVPDPRMGDEPQQPQRFRFQ
jgi:hypothetical protein